MGDELLIVSPDGAQFRAAYEYLKGLEGHAENLGYVNVPTDLGGETIGGRTRKWKAIRGKKPIDIEIWNLVEKLKKYPSFPSNLHNHSLLSDLISDAYENDEWEEIKGNLIPSQAVANEVLEFAVHKNPRASIGILQYCVNKLNYNQKLFPDLKEDGKIGTVTLEAVSILCGRTGDLLVLLKMFNVEQGHYYNERFTEDPDQEANARGFYRRVEIGKRGIA